MHKLAILTPIDHIEGLLELLKKHFICFYRPDENLQSIGMLDVDFVFTNPNSSKFRLDRDFFSLFPTIKAIFTASTGTNHIDLEITHAKGIEVYSLKDEHELINQLSSTAELAFGLALLATRRLLPAIDSVKNGLWDYRPHIGRQFSNLSIGVIGYGRLGRMFCNYSRSFGSKVKVYDPYKIISSRFEQVDSLQKIAMESDLISLHVHHTNETESMINNDFLKYCKPNMTLVNTSRGEIVEEKHLVSFLAQNSDSMYCTDVLSDEIVGRNNSPILAYSRNSSQVIVTPHIGGMTLDGQRKAFYFMAEKLINLFGYSISSIDSV